ncbi:MAG: hypothetical protein UZ03_NOB001000439 [Nitrospira sp. OLB3]|nr:MAG: hypothetical protein UZ03_NOB001000439 [Nitrospira sp. OLB3]
MIEVRCLASSGVGGGFVARTASPGQAITRPRVSVGPRGRHGTRLLSVGLRGGASSQLARGGDGFADFGDQAAFDFSGLFGADREDAAALDEFFEVGLYAEPGDIGG